MSQDLAVTVPQDRSLTEQIIGTISEHEGVDPLEITPPIYDVIDPDAAETLFSDQSKHEPDEGVQLTFSYNGYTITVEGDNIQIQDD